MSNKKICKGKENNTMKEKMDLFYYQLNEMFDIIYDEFGFESKLAEKTMFLMDEVKKECSKTEFIIIQNIEGIWIKRDKFNIYDYVEKKERIEKALKKAKEIVKNEKGIFKLVEVNFGTYQYTQLFLNEIEIKGEKK